MKYAYFLSCINEGMTKEVDRSLDAWKRDLGIEFVKLHEGTCCGGSHAEAVSAEHCWTINARNIALAEKHGLDLVTSCNTCLLGLRSAKKQLDSNQKLRDSVNEILKKDDLEYSGKAEIKHLLWVINEDYGLDRLAEKVKKPLTGVKIAPFYGCHILRPSSLMGHDDPNSPSSLHQLIDVLGGETVNYPSANRCCGFHTMLVAEEESLKLAGDAIVDGIENNADYIVTPCPLCHTMMDMHQEKSLKGRSKKTLPIIHLSQLVGLALGYSEKELGIDKHMIT